MNLGLVSAERLTSLASGRGDAPTFQEWLLLAPLLMLLAYLGTRVLLTFGLTMPEAILVAAVSPLLVFIDAPIGDIAPRVALAANLTGCIIPALVAVKILAQGRLPIREGLVLLVLATVVSFAASTVVPSRGVLLQYRVPALVVGLIAAGLLFRHPERSGAAAFAAGALGVILGADLMHLHDLAGAGAGRIILGGAALMDGILLVAVLAAAVGEGTAMVLRAVVGYTTPTKPTT